MNYRSLDRPAEERTKESAHDNYTKNASMITRTGCLAVYRHSPLETQNLRDSEQQVIKCF